jgi:hypothetical protein
VVVTVYEAYTSLWGKTIFDNYHTGPTLINGTKKAMYRGKEEVINSN